MGLVSWALEILNALVFLRRKRVVHGDIAARNVVLDAELHAKLCDLGMSHEVHTAEGYVYSVSPHVRRPCNSSAPESLDPDRREYSFQSDVYSFGVLLWEMFSLGTAEPWADVGGPEEILRILLTRECLKIPYVEAPLVGGTTDRRQVCVACLIPLSIYEKMKECWILEPWLRPTVEQLHEFLSSGTGEQQSHVTTSRSISTITSTSNEVIVE
jgi:proto-oncogene tyrosine-protein kinase Kit